MYSSVVAAGDLDLEPVAEALAAAGIQEGVVLQNGLGDSSIFNPVPDAVVGVLSPTRSETHEVGRGFTNLDVMLRIGQAAERRLPTLLIAPPPLVLTSLIPGVTLAPCDLDASQALNEHCWAFAATIGARAQHRGRGAITNRADLHDLLREIGELRADGPGLERQVESLTSRLLEAAGAALVESALRTDVGGRIDLAFMASEDSPGVILVEIKAGLLDPAQIVNASEQLQRHVLDRRAQLGIVLYHDVRGRSFQTRHPTPLTVAISLTELAERLMGQDLPTVISYAVADHIGRM